MNQLQTKTYLESKGWSCRPCTCPGAKSYDCLHKDFRGYTIKLKPIVFRITNMGLTIASSQYPNFEKKFTDHVPNKKTV